MKMLADKKWLIHSLRKKKERKKETKKQTNSHNKLNCKDFENDKMKYVSPQQGCQLKVTLSPLDPVGLLINMAEICKMEQTMTAKNMNR